MPAHFDLQGHRGARGLKPENTLPGFEAALDHLVTSVETDVHLTADGVPVLTHDPLISSRLYEAVSGGRAPPPAGQPVRRLTLARLRGYRGVRNPDPARFPGQTADPTPLAAEFAGGLGVDPFA